MKNAMGMKRLLSVALCLCLLLSTGAFGTGTVQAADEPQDFVVEHDHDGWMVWNDEVVSSQYIASGNYYLEDDVTLIKTIYYIEGEVTLCLNGHALYTGSRLISIGSGATLTLTDCTDEGMITGGTKTPVYVNGGTFVLENGSISGNKDGQGGAVYMTDGTFLMKGGSISGNNVNYAGTILGGGVYVNKGTFIMEGGEISGNEAATGAGVYVGSGDFIMRGGSISGNNAKSSTSSTGGGVDVSAGTFTMEGGTISDNYAVYGGGVYVTAGTFTMQSGEISGNTTDGSGGGVYVNRDTAVFTMENGTISNNNAATFGGGVYMNSGTVTMQDGKISGNTATVGGGVEMKAGEFLMQGGVICGNEATSTQGGGVYVGSATFTMESGAISDNTAKGQGGGIYVNGGSAVMENGTISGNQTTSNSGGGVCVYSGSFRMGDGMISGNTASSNGGGVYTRNSSTFTMERGTISENNANFGGGVYIEGSSSFTMEDGKISGNTANTTCGGVYVRDSGGIFTMKCGEVSDNIAQKQGGGVYVGNGSFLMESGCLSGNIGDSAGGVYVGGGDFTMRGGEITGNSTSSSLGSGGGVSLAGSGTFTMESGKISGNTATYSGGGVYAIGSGTFALQGGEISGNTAKSAGGGVYASGTFNVSGTPVVADNTLSGTATATENNISLAKATGYIHVVGELTDGAKLGISRYTDVKETPVLTEGYSAYHTDDAGKYFFYDNAESLGNCDVGTGTDGEAWFGYNVTFTDQSGQPLEEQFVGYNSTATPRVLESGAKHWSTELGGMEFDFTTPITANLTLYPVYGTSVPVLAQAKRQIKMFPTSETTVRDDFQFRVISKISDADWKTHFANTGTADTSANAITELGFVAYKGTEGFNLETAKAAAKVGKDTDDYFVATTSYIQHVDGSDAQFSAIIYFSSAHTDVTYIAYAKYYDAEGAEQYLFYETEKTVLLKTNHEQLVKSYLAAFPYKA